MNSKVAKFIGLNYKLNGRSFDGVDCYGLYWLFNKEVKNRYLPPFVDRKINRGKTMMDVFNEHIDEFEITETPFEGDIMLFKMPNRTLHVGVYIDGQKFLHILKEGTTSCLMNHNDPKYKTNFKYYAKYVS